MNSQEFDRALENISDPLIDSAARAYDRGKRRPGYKKYLRITAAAAAVAILLTALSFWPSGENNSNAGMGAMKVYAYDQMSEADSGNIGRHEMTDSVNPYWPIIPLTSGTVFEIILGFEVDESAYNHTEITFDVSANYGCVRQSTGDRAELLQECEKQQKCILSNGGMFAWHEVHMTESCQKVFAGGDRIFIDVIMKAEDHCVGYAVVEISYNEMLIGLVGQVLDIEWFPVVDGQWHNITEADIIAKIADAHKLPPKEVQITVGSNDAQ